MAKWTGNARSKPICITSTEIGSYLRKYCGVKNKPPGEDLIRLFMDQHQLSKKNFKTSVY